MALLYPHWSSLSQPAQGPRPSAQVLPLDPDLTPGPRQPGERRSHHGAGCLRQSELLRSAGLADLGRGALAHAAWWCSDCSEHGSCCGKGKGSRDVRRGKNLDEVVFFWIIDMILCWDRAQLGFVLGLLNWCFALGKKWLAGFGWFGTDWDSESYPDEYGTQIYTNDNGRMAVRSHPKDTCQTKMVTLHLWIDKRLTGYLLNCYSVHGCRMLIELSMNIQMHGYMLIWSCFFLILFSPEWLTHWFPDCLLKI